MSSTRLAVPLLWLALLASGCGTITNLKTGEPDFYGGVQKDIQWLATPSRQPEGIGIANLGFLTLFVDLPMSIIGDTLTMPIAIYEWHRGAGQTETTDQVGGKGEATTTPATIHLVKGS
jgi:uncharacterized protein YceK